MTYFDSGFQRYQFALLGSVGSRATVRQDVLEAAAWSTVPRGQEAGQRQEGPGLAVHFPQWRTGLLPETRLHFPLLTDQGCPKGRDNLLCHRRTLGFGWPSGVSLCLGVWHQRKSGG